MKYVIILLVFFSCNSPSQKIINGGVSSDTLGVDSTKPEVRRTFYLNSILKEESTFLNDKKEGLSKEYWENGLLSLEGYYKNGLADGMMKWYSEKGHLAAEGNMTDGKRNGIWKICDWQDKEYCTTGMFENDVMVGSWKSFYENGKVERENIWKGKDLLESKCWDELGNRIDCME